MLMSKSYSLIDSFRMNDFPIARKLNDLSSLDTDTGVFSSLDKIKMIYDATASVSFSILKEFSLIFVKHKRSCNCCSFNTSQVFQCSSAILLISYINLNLFFHYHSLM
jgi:hypothetical protein